MSQSNGKFPDNWLPRRRSFLQMALGVCAFTPFSCFPFVQLATNRSGSLTKERRDRMSPSDVVDELKKGNERFRTGKMAPRDYLAEKKGGEAGQYPAAVVLGCIDSRVPVEIVFDTGLGDVFVGRVAGNIVNDDILGSMEYACAVAGAKVVLVLGHTACGAVKGAIDDEVLGNLTGLLARIKPAIGATQFDGEKSSKNSSFVAAVARTNVVLALGEIRRRSLVLEDLEKKGSIKITGAMYDLTTGIVNFVG